MIESLWDTLSFFKLIYGRDVIKNSDGASNMIAEHQGYIDVILSILVDTFISKISLPMQPVPEIGSISGA